MSSTLDLGQVGALRVSVTFGAVLEEPAHDVFLLDAGPLPSTGQFDEGPYLDLLAPLLPPRPSKRERWVVSVNRTHRSGTPGPGVAEIAIAVASRRTPGAGPETVESVRSAFRQILARAGAPGAATLDHPEALSEARRQVQRAFPEAPADRLAVTDEEHHAAQGMWSVGLALAMQARFEVLVGFVDGDPGTVRIRRTGSEIVDSVGTDSSG